MGCHLAGRVGRPNIASCSADLGSIPSPHCNGPRVEWQQKHNDCEELLIDNYGGRINRTDKAAKLPNTVAVGSIRKIIRGNWNSWSCLRSALWP